MARTHITRPARALATLAAAALAAGVLAGPARAQQQETLTVNAANDSLIATGLPGGDTTVQVLRPDAVTGTPVTIGEFSGPASILPFTVNTTVPTAFDPDGDCWQSGSLTLPGGLGLTPDIRAGDTVTLSSGLSLTLPAGADAGGGGGPIFGCDAISAYADNAVTAATRSSGGDVSVSGVAQPLATGVSVTASDGHATTPPVDATLHADGTWTATLPAARIAALADGTLTVDAVYAVPDAGTGAPAHIAGVPGTLTKTTPAPPAGPAPSPPVAPAAPPRAPAQPVPAQPAGGHLTRIRATAQVSLARARRGGIHVSFVVPAGIKVVRVELARGNRAAYLRILAAVAPGTRQTVTLSGAAYARKLARGTYALTVAAGRTRTTLGHAVKRTVRVR
jgi:hypothetical protein